MRNRGQRCTFASLRQPVEAACGRRFTVLLPLCMHLLAYARLHAYTALLFRITFTPSHK